MPHSKFALFANLGWEATAWIQMSQRTENHLIGFRGAHPSNPAKELALSEAEGWGSLSYFEEGWASPQEHGSDGVVPQVRAVLWR